MQYYFLKTITERSLFFAHARQYVSLQIRLRWPVIVTKLAIFSSAHFQSRSVGIFIMYAGRFAADVIECLEVFREKNKLDVVPMHAGRMGESLFCINIHLRDTHSCT